MKQVLVTGAVLLLVLSGCGTSEGDAEGSASSTESAAPSPSEAPAETYFVEEDTTAINAVAEEARQAGVAAQDNKKLEACNKAGEKSYKAWRACWHRLLDPLSEALSGLATGLGTVAEQDLPEACVAELGKAQVLVTGFQARVDKLTEAIDSDNVKAQTKAIRSYLKVVGSIGSGYTKPFQAITQVCYSPEDLESIDAKPSPSPSPSP